MSDTPQTDQRIDLLKRGHSNCLPKWEDFASNLERQCNALAARFTRLDAPKYSGAPMLDSVLEIPCPEFRAWVETLPATYWARYDLSAARIGWEAGRKSAQSDKIDGF